MQLCLIANENIGKFLFWDIFFLFLFETNSEIPLKKKSLHTLKRVPHKSKAAFNKVFCKFKFRHVILNETVKGMQGKSGLKRSLES